MILDIIIMVGIAIGVALIMILIDKFIFEF